MNPSESLGIVRGAVRSTAVPIAGHRSVTAAAPPALPVITISREAGIDADDFAKRLTDLLNRRCTDQRRWASHDHTLIDEVAQEHHLSGDAVARHDERVESIVEAMYEGLGHSPSGSAVACKVAQTIRHLATEGGAVIVGRGGQCILADQEHCTHVRLAASEEWRARSHAQRTGTTEPEALRHIRRIDAERRRFFRLQFHRDPHDLQLYDIVLNLERVPVERAIGVVASMVTEPTASTA